ncbi:hypothetical protein DFH06DRAFT_1350246 [Mycena polygramma]|nr:hypothetical protein DFH06DRAFT_1350246 [Mycena polygramma]
MSPVTDSSAHQAHSLLGDLTFANLLPTSLRRSALPLAIAPAPAVVVWDSSNVARHAASSQRARARPEDSGWMLRHVASIAPRTESQALDGWDDESRFCRALDLPTIMITEVDFIHTRRAESGDDTDTTAGFAKRQAQSAAEKSASAGPGFPTAGLQAPRRRFANWAGGHRNQAGDLIRVFSLSVERQNEARKPTLKSRILATASQS